jgi:hypothetical protein
VLNGEDVNGWSPEPADHPVRAIKNFPDLLIVDFFHNPADFGKSRKRLTEVLIQLTNERAVFGASRAM